MDSKRAAEVLKEHGTWQYDGSQIKAATEMGAQALEAWAWVERTGAKVARFGEGWAVSYQGTAEGRKMHQCSLGPTPLSAVLDAMEKEGNKS